MIARYPWHGTSITKVKHFELSWFLFQNLCYKYKEKIKLFFNSQKELARLLGECEPNWIKAELKLIDKALGPAIRDRGNTVHSWNAKQTEIDFFSTVSFFSDMRSQGYPVDLPDGYFDVDGHYRDAKWALKQEAAKMINDANALFSRLVNFHPPTPAKLMTESKKIVDAVNSGASLKRAGDN